ncbi:MAG: glycine zipper 2TM domain-containing protein [Holosporales bacterium]|jgi:outer membrane lipoprotein SlyB|nr:glycine zipper 2TM domain-containing protein [Holosporales bacterium]
MKRLIALLAGVVILVGCSGSEFSGDRYDTRNVGEVARTDCGTIVSMRKIEIKPDPSIAGTALGAAVGGLGGSLVGGGKGQYLTAAAGAIAGGVAGNAIASRPEEGVEYTIKLDTGSMITIAQGVTPKMSVGQRVHVVNSQKGKRRVVPE